MDAARHSELVALGLVLAQREPHAVEDSDLVEFGILDGVAGFRILLDLAVADDRTFGHEDQFGDTGVAAIAGYGILGETADEVDDVHCKSLLGADGSSAGALIEPRRKSWDTARFRARETSEIEVVRAARLAGQHGSHFCRLALSSTREAGALDGGRAVGTGADCVPGHQPRRVSAC